MKKDLTTNRDLISLNSEVLNEASIEELEERLELNCWENDICTVYLCGGYDCVSGYDICDGYEYTPE